MDIITSLSNPTIKNVVRLHTKKGRKEAGLFIAEGIRVIEEFLLAGWTAEYCFATPEAHIAHNELLKNCTVTEISQPVMQKISAATSASGVLAVFRIPPEPLLDTFDGPVLVLAEIADPGNMGTLIRSAVAFSFSCVLINTTDPYSPKVVQASAGALARAILFSCNWQTFVSIARKRGTTLAALVARHGTSLESLSLSSNHALIVGGEAHGIPSQWIEECDVHITLEMPGGTESLNAAVAGSIAMYFLSTRI